MVKVALTPLSESEFIFLLNKHNHANFLKGGSLSDIDIFRSRKKIQRGRGIFSIISNLGRRALPFLSKYVLPVAKEFGKGLISDVLGGQTIKSSFKKRGRESVKSLGQRIISGKGKKRRMSKQKKQKKQKKPKIKRGGSMKKRKRRKIKRKKQAKRGKGKTKQNRRKLRKPKIVKKKKRRSCHSYMTDIISK